MCFITVLEGSSQKMYMYIFCVYKNISQHVNIIISLLSDSGVSTRRRHMKQKYTVCYICNLGTVGLYKSALFSNEGMADMCVIPIYKMCHFHMCAYISFPCYTVSVSLTLD